MVPPHQGHYILPLGLRDICFLALGKLLLALSVVIFSAMAAAPGTMFSYYLSAPLFISFLEGGAVILLSLRLSE